MSIVSPGSASLAIYVDSSGVSEVAKSKNSPDKEGGVFSAINYRKYIVE